MCRSSGRFTAGYGLSSVSFRSLGGGDPAPFWRSISLLVVYCGWAEDPDRDLEFDRREEEVVVEVAVQPDWAAVVVVVGGVMRE